MRFFERRLELGFDIATAPAACRAATATKTTAEHLFKDVEAAGTRACRAKAAEIKIVEVKAAAAWSSASATRSTRAFIAFITRRWRRACAGFHRAPVLAVLVVKLAVLRVRQHVVSVLQQLELLFG